MNPDLMAHPTPAVLAGICAGLSMSLPQTTLTRLRGLRLSAGKPEPSGDRGVRGGAPADPSTSPGVEWSPHASPGPDQRPGLLERPEMRAGACLAGAAAVWMVLGGWVGLATGLAGGGALLAWLARLRTRAAVNARAEIEAGLPVAADLLAACLLAGSTVERGLESVAVAVGGPLGDRLSSSVARLRLGADPAACWGELATDPTLGVLGRTLIRAGLAGAPVVDIVVRLADEQRTAAHWRAQAAARRVGVLIVAPLGLCFLPAFVAIGIVPMAVSMAATVLPALG